MKCVTKVSSLLKDYELRQKPVIITVTSFTSTAAKDFRTNVEKAHATGQPVIPVIICSPGGQVYYLMSMIDTILSSNLPVATISNGLAMSCGAVLLSCGTNGYRYASPNSTVMIHDVSSIGIGKVGDIKANADEAERLNEKLMKIMSVNCGKKPDFFKNEVHARGHADWYISPEEAKSLGLINHIGSPNLHLSVDVKMTFEKE